MAGKAAIKDATSSAAEAPLRPVGGEHAEQPQLSWQGLGERGAEGSGEEGQVGEATAAPPWTATRPGSVQSSSWGGPSGRIAGVQYARPEPRRVPLSGRICVPFC